MYNQEPLNNDKIEISDETRIYIIDKLVEPYYKNIIKNTIDGRLCWRKTGITFETVSKIMVAFGSILSFSAGFYHDETLSFISGSISCLSLAFLQLSSFSYKENKKQSEELNILLKKLKLDTIPVFERQGEGQMRQMRQYQSSRPAPITNNYNSTYKPAYNPYYPYNLHDKNINYTGHNNYNDTLHSYIPPARSMPSMPSISKIPKRVSSIRSVNSVIPEEIELTEDIINEAIKNYIYENYKKENMLEHIPEHIPEQTINTQNDKHKDEEVIHVEKQEENDTEENDTEENDKQENDTQENDTEENDTQENDTQKETDTLHKPNFLQKSVQYLFN